MGILHSPAHFVPLEPRPVMGEKSAGVLIMPDATTQPNASLHMYVTPAKACTLPDNAHPTARRPAALLEHHPESPVVSTRLQWELRQHPDRDFVRNLIDTISHGAALGYQGPRKFSIATNLASAFEHPEVIDAQIQKECDKGHIAGPYDSPPLENLQCSGVGVVPQKNGTWRMIMHLSAPLGSSVNDGIDPEHYSLGYSTLDDAIRLIAKFGRNALMAKVDLKSAFRMIPVQKKDWDLLGIYWREKFYVDKRLPFGLRSSPFLFNQLAEALQWILVNNYHISAILHYLDDYLLVGPPGSGECKQHQETMLWLCRVLGIPVAEEKCEGPATIIAFLGILIDKIQWQLRLPDDKLRDLLSELHSWADRRKCTKRELLSLIGKLSFAAKVVPAGRLFFRRLINLSTKARRLHHYLHINAASRMDILWWKEFLPIWNGTMGFWCLFPGFSVSCTMAA